jgi:hypothetical protein
MLTVNNTFKFIVLMHTFLAIMGKGHFSVTRIWPACVASAKNNFICKFIVKRDKRRRGAVCCVRRQPGAGHPHA